MLIKQKISTIEQILFLSFSWYGHRRYVHTFAPLQPVAERGGKRLGDDISADPYPDTFGKRKKSAKFGKKGGSVISGMALAANQFLVAAAASNQWEE